MENQMITKNIRNFYQEVKKSKVDGNKKAVFYRTRDSELIGDIDRKLNRWAEYFTELLNGADDAAAMEEDEEAILGDSEEFIGKPTETEIEEAILKLKNNKSGGESGIQAEIWKNGGATLINRLINLIWQIWEEEKMPNDWQNAIICPVHKKGDLTYCTNYRGIALLDVAYKILALILREKLNRYSDNKIGEYQEGFRKGRSTIDQIATLKQIQSSSYEQNLPLHMLFIDYKQAYDSIDRNKIYSALGKMAVPQKIINLIQMSLKYTSNKVAVEGRLSKHFEDNKGLRQGDPLSTALLNLVLENILREAKIHTKGLVYHNRHQIIAYADDITLVTRTKDELNKIFNEIERHSKMYGLLQSASV
nr:unnamed protein product [Callosobruchus chinensis]